MSCLLYNNKWLPIHYRIQYNLCLLMYSVCQQHCPVCISNTVQSVANSTHGQGLRSSTCPTFVVPRTRTKLREHVFSVCGPVAWNALPATDHNTTDSKLFKRLQSHQRKLPVANTRDTPSKHETIQHTQLYTPLKFLNKET